MRGLLVLIGIAFGVSLIAGNALPQERTTQSAFEEIIPKQEESAERGIRWLLKCQNVDGLWGCEKAAAPSAAITGLAILALASTGSTPTKGPYARPMRKGLEKLLRVQARSGQITLNDSTGIGIFYDHSTATLALAELYGMMQDERDDLKIRDRLEKAVQYLYRTQNRDGGWDAQGAGGTSDLAITCSVWMALRSASNAGLSVEDANVKRLERFVRKCATSRGGFTQSPHSGGGLVFYPTSAGLRILYGMGYRNLKEVIRATKILQGSRLGQEHGGQISEWDYCGAFYAVQALLHEGDKAWRTWYPKLRGQLIKLQNSDGSWTIQYCLCCRAYATALAVLCLQAPKRMLPVFQL